jgi:hypothetical protein
MATSLEVVAIVKQIVINRKELAIEDYPIEFSSTENILIVNNVVPQTFIVAKTDAKIFNNYNIFEYSVTEIPSQEVNIIVNDKVDEILTFSTSGIVIPVTSSVKGNEIIPFITTSKDISINYSYDSVIAYSEISFIISTNYEIDVYDVNNPFSATGGTITYSDEYVIHTFTSSGTFQLISGSKSVDYLVVAGGATGGTYNAGGIASGGGGGAGGVIYRTNVNVSQGSYPVIVGAGGSAGTATFNSATSMLGANGNNSTFNSEIAIGGGTSGVVGGSGGGGGAGSGGASLGGAGTSGQGNRGGNASLISKAGGGGGAGEQGQDATSSTAGNGGNGAVFSITGSSVTYAGGGGGGSNTAPTSGGSGGGGTGGRLGTDPIGNGAVNSGGGGGGVYNSNSSTLVSGLGGSGIVIIRYKNESTTQQGPDILTLNVNGSSNIAASSEKNIYVELIQTTVDYFDNYEPIFTINSEKTVYTEKNLAINSKINFNLTEQVIEVYQDRDSIKQTIASKDIMTNFNDLTYSLIKIVPTNISIGVRNDQELGYFIDENGIPTFAVLNDSNDPRAVEIPGVQPRQFWF